MPQVPQMALKFCFLPASPTADVPQMAVFAPREHVSAPNQSGTLASARRNAASFMVD